MMGDGPSERGQCGGYAFSCIGCPLDFAPRTIQFIEYHTPTSYTGSKAPMCILLKRLEWLLMPY